MINPVWKNVYGHRAYFTCCSNAYSFVEAVRLQRDNRYQGYMLDDGGYVVMW
jgi:hypothetical protein